MAEDLAVRILKLREDVAKADQRAAAATTAIQFAKQQVAQVDDALLKMGIVNPEQAEQELAALEAQLEETCTQLAAETAAAMAEYEAVLQLARAAGVGVGGVV